MFTKRPVQMNATCWHNTANNARLCHEKLAAGEQWDPGVNIQTETEALAGLLHRLKLNDVVPTCFVRFMDL